MSKYQSFTRIQKLGILKQVRESKDKKRELAKLGISRSTYYEWLENGGEAKKKTAHSIWNKTPEDIEAKIKEYRLSNDPRLQSPARIMEKLESEGYLITESGVKSVLVRLGLNGFLKPKKKTYHIRPKAEKFLEVVSLDDMEFQREKPHDTFCLNLTDEASYFALESKVLGHKVRAYDVIRGIKMIKEKYGRYPKTVRLDNARAHWANKVLNFCKKNKINLDHIDKGCPEENWPVESWHRNLNQDLIYQKGYASLAEWQKSIDEYRNWHNYSKRLRSDPIQRTPAEIAFAYTTPATQARIKNKLLRKLRGQTAIQRIIPIPTNSLFTENLIIKPLSVSEMRVS